MYVQGSSCGIYNGNDFERALSDVCHLRSARARSARRPAASGGSLVPIGPNLLLAPVAFRLPSARGSRTAQPHAATAHRRVGNLLRSRIVRP